jgi:long-subunit acyl-CoA synthetase (AMP-forming)
MVVKDFGEIYFNFKILTTMSLKTHIDLFLEWKDKKPNEVFLRQPYGDIWKEITWKQAYDEAASITASLRALNIPQGSNIAILSKNCYHWIISDMAISMGGYVSTPFFPTLSLDEFKFLMAESEAKAIFIGKLDKPAWDVIKDNVPQGVEVIKFPHYEGNAKIENGKDWDDLVKAHSPNIEVHRPQLDDLWTILFTSGTTGNPKGVMLSYRSPAEIMNLEMKHNVIGMFQTNEYHFFSYLPLNHIAERMIVEVACLLTGGNISFAENLETFAQNLQSVQPTGLMGVPRIYTKFQMAVLEKLGPKLNILLHIPIINNIIKKKIRYGFGLSRSIVTLTGAAPTPQSLKDWYLKIGINLREIYGMTENAGGCCVMPQNENKSETVGKPLAGVEVKIDPDTDELIMRSPWLMVGYYKQPEKTAEVLRDGWLHTGDVAEITSDGFVKITGRLSDTFKTSKGKFITPGPKEWDLAENNFIEQVCVVGLGLDQPIALVILSEIGKRQTSDVLTESFEAQLQKINDASPLYQHIRKLIVLNDDWTVDNGLLTPTLKIKRRKIDQKYGPLFENWYNMKETVIFIKQI